MYETADEVKSRKLEEIADYQMIEVFRLLADATGQTLFSTWTLKISR
ncbi:hypothetical protein [Staphylococcus pseudintermedius]